jgi:4-aminobutyrate aminotransferase-like enzyme
MYLCKAAQSRKNTPDNNHTQLKVKEIAALLETLLAVNPIAAEDAFRQACKMPSLREQRSNSADTALKSRNTFFSKMLYTHYETPLYLQSSGLQYLYDVYGDTYLDCVNNVSQWGHCNPTIVRSAQKQMAKLNTNSRYGFDIMTEYANELLATFPAELDTVFFVNSGSEANELAMRIARTVTKNKDFIVIDRAYHGNSNGCTDISPHRIDRPGKPGLPSHIHKIPAPDLYRGKYRQEDKYAAENYAKEIDDVLNHCKRIKTAPAAFIAESLVGTGGQFVLPTGYLKHIYRQVRNAGGLCIADEVQVGFARTGTKTWCFEHQDVVPDIVTMGKPMGNGHPMAAVVTTKAIAEQFDNGVTYFNTFGGNPVSCATGLAVLNVLKNDNLAKNVVDMADHLMTGLNTLQQRFDCIGDVRGQGLYIGVELVKDRASKEPATALAKWVIEAFKARFVLLNTNGYDNNIIKIKPPLIVNKRDIDQILNVFEEVLTLSNQQVF